MTIRIAIIVGASLFALASTGAAQAQGKSQLEMLIDQTAISLEPEVLQELPVAEPKKRARKKKASMDMASADPDAALNRAAGKRGELLDEASGGERPEIEPRAPKIVAFATREAPGSIVINQATRELFYVLEDGQAYRYRIAVGKDGFSWSGTEQVSNITEWPDWYPPKEMRERKPELPEMMRGGSRNPLGARAIYLGNTLYRIHGTNEPRSIGRAASSGCFRMHNQEVAHLASIVTIGAKVVVLDRMKGKAKRSIASKSKVKTATRKLRNKAKSSGQQVLSSSSTPLPALSQ